MSLASQNIAAANQPQGLYSVPAGKRATFSLSLTNRSGANVNVYVALCPAGASTPAGDGSNYIEFNLTIPAFTTYERAGLVLLTGQSIFVQATVASVLSANMYGIVE